MKYLNLIISAFNKPEVVQIETDTHSYKVFLMGNSAARTTFSRIINIEIGS